MTGVCDGVTGIPGMVIAQRNALERKLPMSDALPILSL